ncbi:MAG: metallophosphoesterase [Myxococcota bacterium]|nr:metallophosphoesterase [Myxococcota bacterium]
MIIAFGARLPRRVSVRGPWWLLWCIACAGTSDSGESNPTGAHSGSRSAGTGVPSVAAGDPLADTVGPNGGHVANLAFVVVGDTRPASIDDTSAYPNAIITKIFEDIQSLRPAPLFGVSTGDYMFASTRGGQAAAQLDLYAQARRRFRGIMFPAMGNHECTGYTASNCGPGNADGVTDNYVQYLKKFVEPLGHSTPYYVVRVDDTRRTWTAKLVFIAANAWDATQAAWLTTTLAQPTTYTFVVRHESASVIRAPGVSPTEEVMARYPYTLCIVGHAHTYARSGAREIVVGNGGAPLTSAKTNYGFALVQQRPDNAVQIDMIDNESLAADQAFRFALRPDGAPAP